MSNKKNYNKISTEKVKAEINKEVVKEVVKEVESKVEETVTTEEIVKEEPKVKIGVVANCEKLNVRTNPHVNAYVELVINKGTEVEITGSNGDFYSVRKGNASNGFTGWCMKKYIKIKQ